MHLRGGGARRCEKKRMPGGHRKKGKLLDVGGEKTHKGTLGEPWDSDLKRCVSPWDYKERKRGIVFGLGT